MGVAAIVSKTEREYGPKNNRKPFGFAINMLSALVCLLISASPAVSENTGDWMTGLPREPIHVAAWPGGRKIAVCFIFYVEIYGVLDTARIFDRTWLRESRMSSTKRFVNMP